MICEEMIRQRLEGMKNYKGQEIGEAFPKLIYVLDEHNCLEGGKYDYITKLAAKCTAKRLVPDYQSAKIMRENYEGETFPPMGCRSHLSNWKDENGNYKWYGRFNQGVVSLNLPQIAIIADKDMEMFWEMLDQRLELCKDALLTRHKMLLGVTSDSSPIHWQHGAIARLKKGEKIDKLLKNGYSTLSLGYVGIAEMVQAMLGVSHTSEEGEKFALEVMNYMKAKCDEWKKETGHKGYVPKTLGMGGQKEHKEHWSELVFSDYIIRGNKLTEQACMPLWADQNNGQYTEAWPLMKWILTDDFQTILGHKCQKATCRFRGRDFVAWFAADIPVKGGPWKFGGLPGCILKVYDKDRLYVWEAVAIENGIYPISQYPEKLYPKTSRNRIYKLQKRYNEDFWNAVGWMSLEGRRTPKKVLFEPLELE